MRAKSNIVILLLSCFIISSCCKEEAPPNFNQDQFVKITERNELPYTLPTLNNIADDAQTRGIFFYDHLEMDVVFRSIGVSSATTERKRLWVEIRHPDLRMFASTQYDSLFADSTIISGTQVLEVHNRDIGTNFYKLDTAILGIPFSYAELDKKRPALNDNTIVTAHILLKETNIVNDFAYDVERGVLKRINHIYIGFKNIKDGNIFFVELEDRYTLKSIEVRKD